MQSLFNPKINEINCSSGNGEGPVSLSLTLSGGFDATASTGLHSPGSLLDSACVY
jgi:hypothetical protein